MATVARRIRAAAKRNAVWGASIGGELALALGLRHPDTYGAVLWASPGEGCEPPPAMPSPLPRVCLVAGTQEPFFRRHRGSSRLQRSRPRPAERLWTALVLVYTHTVKHHGRGDARHPETSCLLGAHASARGVRAGGMLLVAQPLAAGPGSRFSDC
jgi:pimeloyl-ACP methyl ester carboxylesterase